MESACTTLTEAVRLVHLLKIDGYCAAPAIGGRDGMAEYIKSRWNFEGYDWEIRIYPAMQSYSRGCDPWLALELVFLSKARTRNVWASLGCRLVDPSGNLKPSDEKSVSHKFCGPKDCSRQVFLMPTPRVASSGYTKGDSLTVQCTITVLKELPDVETIPAKEVPVPSSNLHQHLAELLQKETGADVTFLVSGESFAAHKTILAARSPVFSAEFFGHMMEKSSQCVEVKDMEAAAFKAMLHFIYTDTVPELDQKLEAAVTTMAQHLLAAADRYGLDRLKLICERTLSRGINVETAATTLALAEQHNCSQLKAKCVDFITRDPATFGTVSATEGYKLLEASWPLVLPDLLKAALVGRKI